MKKYRLFCCAVAALGLMAASAVLATPVTPVCPAPNAADYYFPKDALRNDDPRSDIFVRDWYSRYLAAMGEPSLSCGELPTTYRFLWLRSFHHPVAVRVTLSSSGATLVAIELSGAGGYMPGTEYREVARELSDKESKHLLELLHSVGFWSLKTTKPSMGMDGAQWIIEGRRSNTYHVVDRWSPRQGGVRRLGLLFLHLAGLTFPKQNIY